MAKRFGLGSYEALRRLDKPPAELADRKARELYVGNLTSTQAWIEPRLLTFFSPRHC